MAAISDELGEYIARDTQLVRDLGWEEFVKERRGQGEFSDLGGVEHPARRLLRKYPHRGGMWFCWENGGRRVSGEHP